MASAIVPVSPRTTTCHRRASSTRTRLPAASATGTAGGPCPDTSIRRCANCGGDRAAAGLRRGKHLIRPAQTCRAMPIGTRQGFLAGRRTGPLVRELAAKACPERGRPATPGGQAWPQADTGKGRPAALRGVRHCTGETRRRIREARKRLEPDRGSYDFSRQKRGPPPWANARRARAVQSVRGGFRCSCLCFPSGD